MNPLFADVRELWRRFVGALVLLSAVGVSAHLVVAAHTEAEREVAALVNLAGRQRMLATRIALQATLAEAAPNETARALAPFVSGCEPTTPESSSSKSRTRDCTTSASTMN